MNNSHEEQRFIIIWRVYPGTCETLYEMELCEEQSFAIAWDVMSEEQSFAIAWDVMSVVRRPGSLQEIDLLRAQTCLKEIVVKIQQAHIIDRAEMRILDQMTEVVHRLYDSVPA